MLKLILASISPRRSRAKSGATELLTQEYVNRASRLQPTEGVLFDEESALFAAAEHSARQPGRSSALLILFDSRGDQLTSEQFAELIGRSRDTGAQRIFFCIGPANGWSQQALARAARVVSLGRMTLPHELARAVAAEQVYRALTILAGHPYHSGH